MQGDTPVAVATKGERAAQMPTGPHAPLIASLASFELVRYEKSEPEGASDDSKITGLPNPEGNRERHPNKSNNQGVTSSGRAKLNIMPC